MCFHQKRDAQKYARLVRKGIKAGGGKTKGVKVVKREFAY